eukprot:TRINITY_DN7097_c0_g1_i4.p2 TRINITY_DN7097_c0_g1~~TRINITY_DN7097_c0_g1_i4.p2  ORF type:complete len:146 (-),score=17.31 TRINITY_DN7097_c0_g1_i4:81-518(-)
MSMYLSIFGPPFVNLPDKFGWNLIMNVVNDNDSDTLENIITWALSYSPPVMLSLWPAPEDLGTFEVQSALSVAIESRASQCVKILLRIILEGVVVSHYTASKVLEQCFCRLVEVYPLIAVDFLNDERLLRDLGVMGWKLTASSLQ